MIKNKEMELEIEPVKVYQAMLSKEEMETGKTSALPREVDREIAAANPQVQGIIAARVAQLGQMCDLILGRIIEACDTIPYGMRWICKQLKVLCVAKFPEATRYEVGSLIGGYIYLRFFNPAVVGPDAAGLISDKPGTVGRRNLILIAKVLQNLSNGVEFGMKEPFMIPMNAWLSSRRDTLQDYFDALIAVDDLEDALQVDKYLEHTGVNIIQVSYNQIFQCHGLCRTHLKELCADPDDPLREIVEALGDAPAMVEKKDDRAVVLQLLDRRQRRMSSTVDHFADATLNPLYLQTKELLLALLRRLPAPEPGMKHLIDFLHAHKQRMAQQRQLDLHEALDNVERMLETIVGMQIIPLQGDMQQTSDDFLWTVAEEAMTRNERLQNTGKRLAMVEKAIESISNHHKYLKNKLEMYEIYLDSVRSGQSQQALVSPEQQKKLNKKKDKKKAVKKKSRHQFSHKELEEMGVLTRLKVDVKKSMLKKCYYVFSMDAPGSFIVELLFKKAIEIPVTKPICIKLEELLRLQENGQIYLELEFVSLNVNLLIYLLNTHFMA